MVAKLSRKAEIDGENWFAEIAELTQAGDDVGVSNQLGHCKNLYIEEHEIISCIRQLVDKNLQSDKIFRQNFEVHGLTKQII